jgi:hypothetical protein
VLSVLAGWTGRLASGPAHSGYGVYASLFIAEVADSFLEGFRFVHFLVLLWLSMSTATTALRDKIHIEIATITPQNWACAESGSPAIEAE